MITSVIPNLESWAKWKLLPFCILQFFICGHPWILGYHYVTFIMAVAADVANKVDLMRYELVYLVFMAKCITIKYSSKLYALLL